MSNIDQQFITDLQREDDVGLVLRGHLHIEQQLVALASLLLPLSSRCDWSCIPYRAKVEIAHACGLSEDVKLLLIKIGKIRNGMAHSLNAVVSKDVVTNLYNSLSDRLRIGLQECYEAMRAERFPGPSSVEPRDLLVLILLNARQAAAADAIALERQISEL